jgi:hypothetical protein
MLAGVAFYLAIAISLNCRIIFKLTPINLISLGLAALTLLPAFYYLYILYSRTKHFRTTQDVDEAVSKSSRSQYRYFSVLVADSYLDQTLSKYQLLR